MVLKSLFVVVRFVMPHTTVLFICVAAIELPSLQNDLRRRREVLGEHRKDEIDEALSGTSMKST